jgi:hypothetical protein
MLTTPPLRLLIRTRSPVANPKRRGPMNPYIGLGSRVVALAVLLPTCEPKFRPFTKGNEPQPSNSSESSVTPAQTADDAGRERIATSPDIGSPSVSGIDGSLKGGAGADGTCDSEDAGVCAPVPLCADASAVCESTCPGCLVAGDCIAPATLNLTNSCQICDPGRDALGWSPNDGVACDDGLFCTEDDVCTGATCAGAGLVCDDGVACNGVSFCNEEANICSPGVSQCGANAICDIVTDSCVSTCQGCVIDGVCVAAGTAQAGNPCRVCDPTQSTTGFSVAVGRSCGTGPTECSAQDTCDAQGSCQPNNLPAQTQCGSPASSACDQADTCDGNGTCQIRTEMNGAPCDDGAFCTSGDQCQGGRCVAVGVQNCGPNRACDEVTNQCICTGCNVGGSCLGPGATNPGNPCQVCDPSRNAIGFSANANAICGAIPTECSAQDTCNAQGECAPNDFADGISCTGSPGGSCQGGRCVPAPVCGDGIRNGNEVCDGGGSTEIGACNPECTGFYEKKLIKQTDATYLSNLGGISGADAICQSEFGSGWKALLVGAARRATINPFAANGQGDWVLHKYTHYYNAQDQLVWRTDSVPLLGVSGGRKQAVLAPLFTTGNGYPWSGYALDWTTLPDTLNIVLGGTCVGWTSNVREQVGSFVTETLGAVASEPCGTASILLCVEQ